MTLADTARRPRTAARPPAPPVETRFDTDGTAIASFVLGLLGTFVFNVVFGPLALILGTVALVRGTRRRGRALLGIALGAADLVILAVLIATHQGVTWTPGF